MLNETALISLESYLDEEWQKLSGKEKALLLNYRRQLVGGMPISNAMVLRVNDVHDRHPDFHVGCIPGGDPA